MADVLLTIAIPTYNRASLLDACLSRLAREFAGNPVVELLVSNNASTDNTAAMVAQHQAANFPPLRYLENESNRGPDFNIAQCFREAAGKYVWIFSDDDLLLPAYGAPLLALLANNNWGVVHLKSLWFSQDVPPQPPTETLRYESYVQGLDFVRDIHYWVTFITGNIVNKQALHNSPVTYSFHDSYLIQLGWILPGIFTGLPNVLVQTPTLACRANNTGGYKLFKVFSVNFNAVTSALVSGNIMPVEAKNIINKKLITEFFPGFVTADNTSFNKEAVIGTLYTAFKSYPEFWLNFLPGYYKSNIVSQLRGVKRKIKHLLVNITYKIIHSSEYENINPGSTFQVRSQFKELGENSQLPDQRIVKNPQYISIGKNFSSLYNLRLEAWDEYAGQKFTPQLIIGDNVNMNTDCHIGCINKIVIGNNVLMASRIYTSDHSHGQVNSAALSLPPVRRPLHSKGPVIIGDNVWIGEGVCILPGITVGANSIIGANAVVTKDVPMNAVVGGNPARIIRML